LKQMLECTLKQATSPACQSLFAHSFCNICLSIKFPEFFVSRPVQAENCGPSPCINLELVRKGGTILYCDYVVSVNCVTNSIVCLFSMYVPYLCVCARAFMCVYVYV
jgi:hypothetical protein